MAESDTTRELRDIARLSTAADLNSKIEKLRTARQTVETQWKMNLAFFKGRQYTYWNRAARKLMELPTKDGDKPRHRVRLTSNIIAKNSLKLLAKLTKTKPQFGATPGSSDESSIQAAEAAQELADYWWHALKLDEKYRQALMWAIVASSGWWLVDWDRYAGTPFTYMKAPDGTPIINDDERKAFSAQLQAMQLDPKQFEETAYLGDVRVRVLSPFQVFLDPTAETASEAKYAICELFLAPADIAARWKVYLEPDSVPTPADEGLAFVNGKDVTDRCTKRVYYGIFLPTPDMPKGRCVYWTDDRILEDGPYEGCHNQLPLIKFPGIPNPGSVYDMSVVEGAIDDQKEYNRTLSQIVEYKNMFVRPQWRGPYGSLRGRLTNEAGAFIEYQPVAGLAPEPIQMPALQPYILEHLAQIKTRLDEDFFLTQVSEGTLPPNVEAGVAIDLLQEASTDAIAPLVMAQEAALENALQILLYLAEKYYNEPRIIQVTGVTGTAKARQFVMTGMDGVKIKVESFSSLPRSRAGRSMQITAFVQAGIIPPDQAWRHLDLANLKALEVRFRADEDMAAREHDKLIKGEPLNPEAVEQAMQQIQQSGGINPQTGQPFQSQDEINAFLDDASLQPYMFENYGIHMDVHSLKLKSVEAESWPPEVRQKLQRHFELTLQAMQSLPAQTQPAAAPRVSMQFKGTVGPTAAAQMLNKAGVPVTPDQLQEPPLETWVSDDTSKPDDPNAFVAGMQQHMEQAAQHQQQLLAMEQAQAQMAQQGQQMANAQDEHDQKLVHASQAHQQKLAHAEEQHRAKVKQMNRPAPKPSGR